MNPTTIDGHHIDMLEAEVSNFKHMQEREEKVNEMVEGKEEKKGF